MPGTPSPGRHRRPSHLVLGTVAAALLLAGCRDPDLTPPAPAASTIDASDSPGPASDVVDPRDEALHQAGTELLATLLDAQLGFESLGRASSTSDARPVVRRLRAVLTADPRWQDVDEDGQPDELGVRSLLPGPISSRDGNANYGDAFSAVLTASQDAGALGAAYVDLLRDPIVSDLGAWQRDPEGVLAAVERHIRRVRTVAQAEDAIGQIEGEGPRALAWALLAAQSTDLETIQAYGARGGVHVGLMLDALRTLLES